MNLKKGDIIIVVILLVALGAWLYNSYIANKTAIDYLVIEVNGAAYKKIPVSELKAEQLIHIEIDNNKHIDIVGSQSCAYVKDVTCPDSLCEKTGIIDKVGQNIVCLPNRVVIYFEGKENSQVDNVAY